MPSTIRDLTELTAVAVDDYFLVSDTSDLTNRDKKISQINLLGADVSRLSAAQMSTALKTFSGGINLVAPTAILNVGDPAATDTINASGTNPSIGINRYINNTGAGNISFRKSRHATIGSHTIVQNGDDLGRIFFAGSNGASFDTGAAIIAKVDGTPGVGDMPTRLEFQTSADGTATPTTVLTLGANNLATFAGGLSFGASPQTTLSWNEEGSWTPQIADAATGGNLAGGTFTGRYYRIGNMVTVWANLLNLVQGGMVATQALHVRNLPYPCRAISGWFWHGLASVSRFTFTGFVTTRMIQGTNYLFFLQHNSGLGSQETNILISDIGTSGFADLYFTVSYLI